jgi:hypothetical protein
VSVGAANNPAPNTNVSCFSTTTTTKWIGIPLVTYWNSEIEKGNADEVRVCPKEIITLKLHQLSRCIGTHDTNQTPRYMPITQADNHHSRRNSSKILKPQYPSSSNH